MGPPRILTPAPSWSMVSSLFRRPYSFFLFLFLPLLLPPPPPPPPPLLVLVINMTIPLLYFYSARPPPSPTPRPPRSSCAPQSTSEVTSDDAREFYARRWQIRESGVGRPHRATMPQVLNTRSSATAFLECCIVHWIRRPSPESVIKPNSVEIAHVAPKSAESGRQNHAKFSRSHTNRWASGRSIPCPATCGPKSVKFGAIATRGGYTFRQSWPQDVRSPYRCAETGNPTTKLGPLPL